MRRHDREITNRDDIVSILNDADVCRIALTTDSAPYIIPLNFGYIWNARLELFFHSAREGRKLELIKQGGAVGFEIDVSHELIRGNEPCGWGMSYRSIVGSGAITVIEDPMEKENALDVIMKHYGYVGKPTYDKAVFGRTVIYKLMVEALSAKQRK